MKKSSITSSLFASGLAGLVLYLSGLVLGSLITPNLEAQIKTYSIDYFNGSGVARGSLSVPGSIFVTGTGNGLGIGNISIINTAPTISSGFGSGPSIASNNGTFTFRVNVGTGGAATSGVVGLPTATAGWNCQVIDMTNNTVTRETASTTTTVTVTAAAAWAASDILIYNCAAY